MEGKRNTWGGKREGAGRPKTSPMVSHLMRPRIEKRKSPIQIKIILRGDLPPLTDADIFTAFERGCHRARRFGIRIIHYVVLPKHIHLIIEAKKTEELEHSFKSLNTTLAIAVKKKFKELHGTPHQGPVFLGRYHLKILSHPDEMKVALREVLGLAVEHFDASAPALSSALVFDQWKKLFGPHFAHARIEALNTDEAARLRALQITATPQFWLNQAGWLQATQA